MWWYSICGGTASGGTACGGTACGGRASACSAGSYLRHTLVAYLD